MQDVIAAITTCPLSTLDRISIQADLDRFPWPVGPVAVGVRRVREVIGVVVADRDWVAGRERLRGCLVEADFHRFGVCLTGQQRGDCLGSDT